MLTSEKLDRSNLNNAYLSGMKADLNFKGDQLTQINTCFTIGYVFFPAARQNFERAKLLIITAMFLDKCHPTCHCTMWHLASGSLR